MCFDHMGLFLATASTLKVEDSRKVFLNAFMIHPIPQQTQLWFSCSSFPYTCAGLDDSAERARDLHPQNNSATCVDFIKTFITYQQLKFSLAVTSHYSDTTESDEAGEKLKLNQQRLRF